MMPLTQCIPRPSQSKRTRNLEPRLFRSQFLVRASARPEITGEKPMLTESERFRPFDRKKNSKGPRGGNTMGTTLRRPIQLALALSVLGFVANYAIPEAASKDAGYLVSKNSYKNFIVRVEFWPSDDANSGIYFRCLDPKKITDRTCYEANIFDQRPDPSYGTGAITRYVEVNPMPKAGGKWNTY